MNYLIKIAVKLPASTAGVVRIMSIFLLYLYTFMAVETC